MPTPYNLRVRSDAKRVRIITAIEQAVLPAKVTVTINLHRNEVIVELAKDQEWSKDVHGVPLVTKAGRYRTIFGRCHTPDQIADSVKTTLRYGIPS